MSRVRLSFPYLWRSMTTPKADTKGRRHGGEHPSCGAWRKFPQTPSIKEIQPTLLLTLVIFRRRCNLHS